MKIPSWFVIGCGLIVLNLILVIGGTVSRHASAEPPDESQKVSNAEPRSEREEPQFDAAATPPTLANEPVELPPVPSLENNSSSMPNVVSLEEIKTAVGEMESSADLLAPLDAMIRESSLPVSEQLSNSYFESMKLRLKTVKNLNQSTIGLVDEAAILYQRGEISEAQKLLGIATQLRETTARLLVIHQ